MPRLVPSRAALIHALRDGLRGLEFIHAAWLEGADAQGRADDYSDVDLWLDVEDGREDDALDSVRRVLETFGPLNLNLEVDHPHPLIRQAFLRPRGVSIYLFVDLCIQSHSREFVFTEGKLDERVLVLFDKGDVLRFEQIDEVALQAEISGRAHELERFAEASSIRVRKEIERGRYLEALGAYHNLVLEPLVEALRLRLAPTKAEFHLKDVTRDLTADDVRRLSLFYVPRNLEDIERLLPLAIEWAHETLESVTERLTSQRDCLVLGVLRCLRRGLLLESCGT